MYKIVPVTNKVQVNVMTCFMLPGVSVAPVTPQGVLPDISLYKVCVLCVCLFVCLCVRACVCVCVFFIGLLHYFNGLLHSFDGLLHYFCYCTALIGYRRVRFLSTCAY